MLPCRHRSSPWRTFRRQRTGKPVCLRLITWRGVWAPRVTPGSQTHRGSKAVKRCDAPERRGPPLGPSLAYALSPDSPPASRPAQNPIAQWLTGCTGSLRFCVSVQAWSLSNPIPSTDELSGSAMAHARMDPARGRHCSFPLLDCLSNRRYESDASIVTDNATVHVPAHNLRMKRVTRFHPLRASGGPMLLYGRACRPDTLGMGADEERD